MIARILATKRQEVESLKGGTCRQRRKPVIPLVCNNPVNIIAELKSRSPSAGFIREIDSERIRTYSRYASAISVVTDSTYFGGSLQLSGRGGGDDGPVLSSVKTSSSTPSRSTLPMRQGRT